MIPIWDVNPAHRTPYVTIALLVLNVVAFAFWQPTFSGSGNDDAEIEFVYENAMIPCEVTRLDQLSDELVSDCAGETAGIDPTDDRAYFPDKSIPLSIIASLFIHGGLWHLIGNMWFLLIFGNNVEDRFGHIPFLLFYIAGGIAAAVGHIISDPNSIVPVIGASGAIGAVMGAYLVLFPRARIRTVIIPIVWRTWPLFAWFVLLQWLVVQFFTPESSGVAWVAHVVGFAFGVGVALIVNASKRRQEPSPWPAGFGPD